MEIEFKFHIEDDLQANGIFEDPEVLTYKDEDSEETIELHAIYFDTQDRRLSREGITFRARKEGEAYVGTLKWNGASEKGLHEREEINVPIIDLAKFTDPSPDIFVGSEMQDKIIEIIGKRELQKRVEVKVTRKQFRIDTGKSICEISYDKGIAINGDAQGEISELEIELYSGLREDMEEFVEKIAKKHGLLPENRSKFKQGLELNP